MTEHTLKGEDFYQVAFLQKEVEKKAAPMAYGYFTVLDGHNGPLCGSMSEQRLLSNILQQVPSTYKP